MSLSDLLAQAVICDHLIIFCFDFTLFLPCSFMLLVMESIRQRVAFCTYVRYGTEKEVRMDVRTVRLTRTRE